MIWGSLRQLLTRLRSKTLSAPPNTISAESARWAGVVLPLEASAGRVKLETNGDSVYLAY
jgi:hypothetical protein